MKSITIKRVSSFAFRDSPPEAGFCIYIPDDKEEATLTPATDDVCTKLIPKECTERFWNEVQSTVNLQQVLEESSQIETLDGFYLIIELECGCQTLSLTLCTPDKETFRARGMKDSCRLMELIEGLVDELNSYGGEWDVFNKED